MKPSWHGIIADDLTGATDAAVPFARAGFRAAVALGMAGLAGLKAEVLGITTNTRHDSPAVARRKVRRACNVLHRQGVELLYKKMDSTVQGNIVAEAEAARDAGGFSTVLVCPANPAQGRMVQHGILSVKRLPFAHLPSHFAAQGLREYGVVDAPLTLAKVSDVLRHGYRFVIADAASDEDLAVLVRAALRALSPVLLAGSAGLAAQLARFLKARGRSSPQSSTQPRNLSPAIAKLGGPTLVFSGSNNLVTERQIETLMQHGGAGLFRLTIPNANAIRSALSFGQPAIIRVPVHRLPDRVLLHRLAGLSPLLREGRIGNLLLTGGDTARLVCRWLRPRGIALHGEVRPGLAYGALIGGLADGLTVCTKPGGFGDDSSLLFAVRFFSSLLPVGSTQDR